MFVPAPAILPNGRSLGTILQYSNRCRQYRTIKPILDAPLCGQEHTIKSDLRIDVRSSGAVAGALESVVMERTETREQRRLWLRQMVLRTLRLVALVQATVAAVIMVVARNRRKGQPQGFPHSTFPQVLGFRRPAFDAARRRWGIGRQ